MRIHVGVCCSFSSLQTTNEVQMHWGRSSLHRWALDGDASRRRVMRFAAAGCPHHGPEKLHWLLVELLIPKRFYTPRSSSSLTTSVQLIQQGVTFIYLPVFTFFSALTWFIGSLCLHVMHGCKICLLEGEWFLLPWVSGCITCTGLIFRAEFLFMHGLSQLSPALMDTWLQMSIRWSE